MNRLMPRVTRLEAQAWAKEWRRLARLTATEVDAELARLAVHYGVCVEDYTNFVETLDARTFEALCTGDLATIERCAHAFQCWRRRRDT